MAVNCIVMVSLTMISHYIIIQSDCNEYEISAVTAKKLSRTPSVVQKIRFCCTKCWQDYRENLKQQALAAQSQINFPEQQQQDTIQYIQDHRDALEPGSIDWIVAAVSAASLQEVQADIFANAIF
jgi:hypothetical protein